MTSLEILHLRAISGHSMFGEPGARILAPALMRLTTLKELNLAMNGVGNEGLAMLRDGPIRALTSLTKLSVGRNMIDDEGKEAIREMLKDRCEELDINSSDDSENS
mmetsp:Transcript_59100/g.156972  ORF Transcript_59100/g.156972 Transcript_59100/m.156972 type:complete len:106 (+) Transcript_59100:1158-1475(+)